jgi:hypothetical protein
MSKWVNEKTMKPRVQVSLKFCFPPNLWGTDTFILISSKTFVLSHIDGGMGKKKVIFMMNI